MRLCPRTQRGNRHISTKAISADQDGAFNVIHCFTDIWLKVMADPSRAGVTYCKSQHTQWTGSDRMLPTRRPAFTGGLRRITGRGADARKTTRMMGRMPPTASSAPNREWFRNQQGDRPRRRLGGLIASNSLELGQNFYFAKSSTLSFHTAKTRSSQLFRLRQKILAKT